MNALPYPMLLFLVMNCSTQRENLILAQESWKGLDAAKIEKHPYFKNLKVIKLKNDRGPETWIYKDQSPVPTNAYCDSLGGCEGLTFYNCESAFSVKDGRILGLEQTGVCPGPKTMRARTK